MALKHLLVHLDHGRNVPVRTGLALRLAGAHGASLTGLHVRHGGVSRAMPTIASVELSEQLRNIIAAERGSQEDDERAILDRFIETARAASVPAVHHVESALDGTTVVAHIVRYARTADIVILGKPEDGETVEGGGNMVHDVLFGAGAPVIVVPSAPPEDAGRRVVIAWNGSREAARAVKDALPILERAEKVTVLCVDQDGQGGNMRGNVPPGRALADQLSRHGIAAAEDNIVRGGIAVGDAILSRIADLGGDLLVMGAWGHSRLRQFVLGGVTRRILENCAVPVLMSH
jgi:nucleotide-binding universal stress UspA family protein